MRSERVFAMALAALLATGVLAACGGGGESDATPTNQAPAQRTEAPAAPADPRRVQTVVAEPGELTATKNVSATIEASRQSQVAAGASGRVTRVLARPGTFVAAGDPVVTLDDDQLRSQVQSARLSVESAQVNLTQAQRQSVESIDQLEAQLQSARSSLQLAEDRYREAQALLEAGGISRVEVQSLASQRDQAQSAFLQAHDALARARRASEENLRLLELQVDQAQNQLAQVRDQLTEARITAPFAGEIADVYVEEGEFVGAGSPVFRLIAQDERRAIFSVPAADAPLLQEQGIVYVRHSGLDHAAQITRVTRSAQEPRLVQLSADLYPADTPIPTGSVAQIRYTVPLAEGIVVPSASLVAEGGTTYVFAARDGVARRTSVRVVAESGSRAVVEGLPSGTDVISPRPLDVREGTPVQPVDE